MPMQPDKLTVSEVMPFVWRYRDNGNRGGGSLHIVLEDGNIKDRDIEFCIKQASTSGDFKGYEIGKMLLDMSATQRRKICRMFYD